MPCWQISKKVHGGVVAHPNRAALNLCIKLAQLRNMRATADLSKVVGTDRILTSQHWREIATDCPGVQISLTLGIAAETAAHMVQNEM